MMYKIRHGLIILDNSECRLIPSAKRLRTDHDQSYAIPYSRANYHQYSYVPTTIRDWNALPAQVVIAPLLEPVQGALVGLTGQLNSQKNSLLHLHAHVNTFIDDDSCFTRITHESSKAYFQWGPWDLRFYVVSERPACPGDRSPYLSLTRRVRRPLRY